VVQHQEDDDLLIATQFFAARELKAQRIPTTSRAKTTDFKILRGAALVAFCEVKSPQDVSNERLTDAIRQAPPDGRIVGTIKVDLTSQQYRRMKGAATQAVAQFNAVNRSRSVPNILMFVNRDSHSCEDDFVHVVTGYNGLQYEAQSLRKTIPEIDAYVWLDAKTPEKPRMLWQQNHFRDTIIDLLKPPT
jgi:hypothetical protein